MRRVLVLLFFCTVFLANVATAGLIEVNASTFLRESGSPEAESISVDLENAGEIRIANLSLEDGSIEVASSTDVSLDGTSILSPFELPAGGSVVFPVQAGVHVLEVTLRGKVGGGVKVSFYEDKPDVAEPGKGWQLLDDGTVLHRKTGLIWHRNAKTPGLGLQLTPTGRCESFGGCAEGSVEEYRDALNAGLYGSDSTHGNAGHSDWRVPTPQELSSALDRRVSAPAIADRNGDATEYAFPRNGVGGGMAFGDPLYLCISEYRDFYFAEGWLDDIENCPAEFDVGRGEIITLFRNAEGGWARDWQYVIGVILSTGDVFSYMQRGLVWPVRGGQ